LGASEKNDLHVSRKRIEEQDVSGKEIKNGAIKNLINYLE